MSRLLVIDDEPSICWGLSRLGEQLGHDVVTASSAEQALQAADQAPPDVIVLDVRLPGMDGLTAIEHLRRRLGPVPVILITAYGDLQTAVEAVRRGAFEYIVKPFDVEQVQRAVTRAVAARSMPPGPHASAGSIDGMVGSSPAMQQVFKQIALAAASEACVLISGESGTGKELAARAIHKYSRRGQGPFVAVNVAALSPTLAESELFGHVQGAFTGADFARSGLLVEADGGTLFLDEVADIPLPVQVKLLRALEHGEVTPVGSNQPVRTDFRVISATHQSLPDRVTAGLFRHDLYFRLCAFQIQIPPLRRRQADIEPLVQHFLGQLCRDDQRPASVSPETLIELKGRPWYGNVRELRNALEHAMILARGGVIMPEHLPPPSPATLVPGPAAAGSEQARIEALLRQWAEAQLSHPDQAERLYDQLLALVEPPLLQAAMRYCQGNCAAAARHLGLHRTTLRRKLDQYGINPSS